MIGARTIRWAMVGSATMNAWAISSGGQAAEQAQGQRDPGRGGQHPMTRDKDQPEDVVGQGFIVDDRVNSAVPSWIAERCRSAKIPANLGDLCRRTGSATLVRSLIVDPDQRRRVYYVVMWLRVRRYPTARRGRSLSGTANST